MRPLYGRERLSDWQSANSRRLRRLLWFCLSQLAKVIDDHYIRFGSTRHAKEERRSVRRYSETPGEVLDGCDLLAFAGGEIIKSNRSSSGGRWGLDIVNSGFQYLEFSGTNGG